MRLILSAAGLVTALGLAAIATAQPAFAQSAPIETYCAQISDHDKYASDGFHLTDAGSILRQDRANFHRFGTPDADDYANSVFTSTAARERIPAMVDNGMIEPGLARQIVRAYPYVCVDIYRNFLNVYVGG